MGPDPGVLPLRPTPPYTYTQHTTGTDQLDHQTLRDHLAPRLQWKPYSITPRLAPKYKALSWGGSPAAVVRPAPHSHWQRALQGPQGQEPGPQSRPGRVTDLIYRQGFSLAHTRFWAFPAGRGCQGASAPEPPHPVPGWDSVTSRPETPRPLLLRSHGQ